MAWTLVSTGRFQFGSKSYIQRALGEHLYVVKTQTIKLSFKAGSDSVGTFTNGNGDFRPAGSATLVAGNYSSKWHHLVAVGTGGQTKLYIDGSHVGNTDRQSTSDILSIGNYQSGGQRFAKYLDDFRIYNVALTDANIVDVYGNGEGDFGPVAEITVNSKYEYYCFSNPYYY